MPVGTLKTEYTEQYYKGFSVSRSVLSPILRNILQSIGKQKSYEKRDI
jgi:hypothetical protein